MAAAMDRFIRSPVSPWTGIIVGPIAWLINHQGIGDAIYFDCRNGNPVVSAVVGGLTLLLAVVGGFLSWTARRKPDVPSPEPQSRYFLALISAMLCALFTVAIALQTLAGFILPGCYA